MGRIKVRIINALCIVLFAAGAGMLLADGLPGEYYVTQRWRDFFAGHSPATNPAFMTDENYLSARLAISPTLQNTFYLMELGAILPVGLYQSVGFWILSMINAYVQFGSDYWGLVFGFNIPTMNVGRDFQVAYQYMSIIDDIDLTNTHTFYFRGDFGKHREEIYARKMAKIASLGPNVLYNEARTLYAQGKYWEAFFTFGKILTDYADFFKNDWVQLHMALCQEKLDMKEAAERLLCND